MIEKQARAAADEFRAANDLGLAPVGDLVALIEQARGVDVTVLPINEADEHGLTMRDPVRGVSIIAVRCSDHPMRWRSNLAHELGHLVFNDHEGGRSGVVSANGKVEQRAQSFARHLLIPIGGIEHVLDRAGKRSGGGLLGGVDLRTLSELVQRFQVSPAVAAIQLRDMGVIDSGTHAEWLKVRARSVASRFGWADQYTAMQAESRQPRAPQRLLARAVAGYIAGLVSLETVASIRGASPDAVEREFLSAGIEPNQSFVQLDEQDLLAGAEVMVDVSWLDDE